MWSISAGTLQFIIYIYIYMCREREKETERERETERECFFLRLVFLQIETLSCSVFPWQCNLLDITLIVFSKACFLYSLQIFNKKNTNNFHGDKTHFSETFPFFRYRFQYYMPLTLYMLHIYIFMHIYILYIS